MSPEQFVLERIGTGYPIGLILSTSLRLKNFKPHTSLSYADIPSHPKATVPGHEGKLEAGELSGKKVVVLKGRVHYYEGYSPEEVTLPVRLLKELGVNTLILTNAVGSTRHDFGSGDLVLISDQINLTGLTPLRGRSDSFVSMARAYDKDLQTLCLDKAASLGIKLKTGVYAGTSGPQYESPAEARMLTKLGADLIGMSTVLETIEAKYQGMRTLGLSVVCNPAGGESDHLQVIEVIDKAAERADKLLTGFVEVL